MRTELSVFLDFVAVFPVDVFAAPAMLSVVVSSALAEVFVAM